MKYDRDYYERGVETGKSNFTNYRWMPEETMSMAMTLIDYLNILRQDRILDYGCAKGFLVKAFRLLHRQAWGVDISEYALSRVESEYQQFCRHVSFIKSKGFPHVFDVCIAKDVFEHIDPMSLHTILCELPARRLFAVVPLGSNGKYNAEANNMDKSHIICENEMWWGNTFHSANWVVVSFSFKVDGIKDHYRDISKSHGFYILKRKT